MANMTAQPANQTTAAKGNEPKAPVETQPFVRGALPHIEPLPLDKSLTPGSAQLVGLIEIPAHGWLRGLILHVDVTGGTGTAAVYKEDAPWSFIELVELLDTNGAAILTVTGYELYLIHKLGGYVGQPDPTRNPAYVAPTTAGNTAFSLRIPVELSGRDGLGSLPNQNAAQPYQLRVKLADKGDVYSTDPTGIPTVRIRGEAEMWSPPAAMDLYGRPIAQVPPAEDTTQFWSRQVFNVAAGRQMFQLKRMGNVIRNTILIFRTTAPARDSSGFPSTIDVTLDSKQVMTVLKRTIAMQMAERQIVGTPVDAGVLLLDNTSDWDGLIGGEMRDRWLPTTAATRYEIGGTWPVAGTLTVLTNDVAPSTKGPVYF